MMTVEVSAMEQIKKIQLVAGNRAQQELIQKLYEAMEHLGTGVMGQLPLIKVERYDSPVRGFFMVFFDWLPTITINLNAFQAASVHEAMRTLAHELVHFELWQRGEEYVDHDERFWEMAEETFGHWGPDEFGTWWHDVIMKDTDQFRKFVFDV